MTRVRIKIVTLDHGSVRFNKDKIAEYKSSLFEINSVIDDCLFLLKMLHIKLCMHIQLLTSAMRIGFPVMTILQDSHMMKLKVVFLI